MLEAYFRTYYQRWLVDKLAVKISQFASPNLITLYAVLWGIATAILLSLGYSHGALIALMISGYLDSLDGTIARLTTRSTPLGTALDIIGDRIVEFAVIFGLYLIAPPARATTIILMLGSVLICICSFLVVGIFTQNTSNKSFHYSSGMMERFETFLFFFAMILFPHYFIYLGYAFTLLVSFTAILRIKEFAHVASISLNKI